MHLLLPERSAFRRRSNVQLGAATGTWYELSRRRKFGALLMAALAVGVLAFRRVDYDSVVVLVVETLGCIALLALASFAVRRTAANAPVQPLTIGLVAAALALPWAVDWLARRWGYGNGMEIVMLSSLAWGGVAAAMTGRQPRTIGLSVVCSGFLTLFTTFISDSATATWFTYAWGMLCSWWLVTNHWERVEACAASQVTVAKTQRLLTIVGGCAVFALTATLFSNRLPVLRQLTTEIMPTSGGTGSHDAAARSGVGNGDALVAARNHATSFGAVETDLFLDSDQPSLFDVFSEEFGEPMKLRRHEQAQALSPDEIISQDGKFAEANRSSGTQPFSTNRRPPPKHSPQVKDLASEALMFWAGEAGVRLAVERYDQFDGWEWHKSPTRTPGATPTLVDIEDRAWFQPTGGSVQNSLSPFVGVVPEALKFTRYREPIIPTRSGMQLWSIEQLIRPDFFLLSPDNCLSMPGREHIPDYTVVRFINSQIDMERLESLLESCAPGMPHARLSAECESSIARWSHELITDKPRGWEQVAAIVEGVRHACTLDRTRQFPDHSSPLEGFLAQRAGPAYLFATTTALMLEHVGYKTRLVTGFYTNPEHRFSRDKELAILPRDAHVWLEVNAGHGYWIPLEPSPGFLQPIYRTSWWYQLVKARTAIALSGLACISFALVVYLLRRFLFEIACRLAWPLIALLSDRRKVAWLTRIIDLRWSLAGQPRTPGTIPREQFRQLQPELPAQLKTALRNFWQESDRLWFGGERQMSQEGRRAVKDLWRHLTTAKLRDGRKSPVATQPL